MPSAKDKTTSLVGEYDIELMTVDELKMYIQALKEEHDRMRRACTLYQDDDRELKNFLKCTKENVADRKGKLMQKEIDIADIIMDGEGRSRFQDLQNVITEAETNQNADRDWLESFIKVHTNEVINKETEDSLKKNILERQRELDMLDFTCKLISTEMSETKEQKWYDLSKAAKQYLETMVQEYVKKYGVSRQKLVQGKIDNMLELLEKGKENYPQKNPLTSYLAKMDTYFKDLFLKNSQTLETLNDRLAKVKKEHHALKMNLKDIKKENSEMRKRISVASSGEKSPIDRSKTNVVSTIEELTYENHLLTSKLRMAKNDQDGLKKHFVSAVRKIYQKADFEAYLLQQMIHSVQKASGKVNVDTQPQSPTEKEDLYQDESLTAELKAEGKNFRQESSEN